MSRENWLIKATELLRKELFEPIGETVPEVKVSVGFAYAARKAIGQCWSNKSSEDNKSQVFICPTQSESSRVLDILAHELIHAIYPTDGHRGNFPKVAKKIGLKGKMTATVAGPELNQKLAKCIEILGEYPHSKLKVSHLRAKKKQSTRMLKAKCCGCGYVIRSSQKWFDQGLPSCVCGNDFQVAQ